MELSVFALKLIALCSMLIDHIGYGFAGNQFWMRFIGRTAFILYAFMIAESFFHLREVSCWQYPYILRQR